MATSTAQLVSTGLATARTSLGNAPPELPVEYNSERWYAAYTSARHEKQVAVELKARAVEHFLPLQSSVHRWKDRRVRLDLPLFPGYVFVRLALVNRLRVLQIPSVVRLVGFGGKPVPLPDKQMEILRIGLAERLNVKPHPFLAVGRRVRIVCGPLAGLEGVLRQRKGTFRFVLSVKLIRCSLAVDVAVADVVPIPESAKGQRRSGHPSL